jgi:hypothetical protein
MSANQNLSLYIPRVFSNFSQGMIAEVFEKLHLGKVSKVDLVAKYGHDGQPYNSVYVHFEYWNDTIAARNFQARVLDPNQEARLVYDEPWYWIVLENTAKKHISGQPKPRIALDTPVINRVSTVPAAPQKPKTESEIIAAARATGWHWPCEPRRLEDEFEDEAQHWIDEQIDATIDGQMNIVEDLMDDDDNRLATFERGYVQMLEEENAALRRMVR